MRVWNTMSFLLLHSMVSIRRGFTKQIKHMGILPTAKSLAPNYYPTTENQRTYVKALNDEDTKIVLGVGPAGCGKTLFACNTAIQLLKAGAIQKIILTRPLVSVEEEIGFLPGNLISKMDPWTRPIFDIMHETYSKRDVDTMLQTGVIEISPLAYMRGRTFKNAFIIADEMQNSSPNQMMMVTTRIGEKSKMVITGDLKQSDRMDNNGLYDLISKIKSAQQLSANATRGIQLVEMNSVDVKRSEIVSTMLNIYNPPKTVRLPISPPPVKITAMNISTIDAAMLPKTNLPRHNTTVSYPRRTFYC